MTITIINRPLILLTLSLSGLVSSSFVHADQSNTLKAPGYGLVNATLGYTPPSKPYHLFLNVRNLADKRYAASTQYFAQARANEAAFNSGLGRSLFVGAKILW